MRETFVKFVLTANALHQRQYCISLLVRLSNELRQTHADPVREARVRETSEKGTAMGQTNANVIREMRAQARCLHSSCVSSLVPRRSVITERLGTRLLR